MQHIYVETDNRIRFMWLQTWLQELGYSWPHHPNRPEQKYQRHGKVDYGNHIKGIHIYPKRKRMYILGDDTFSFDYTDKTLIQLGRKLMHELMGVGV